MSWSQEGQSNGAELLELFRGGPIRESLPNGVLYMSKQAGKHARTQGSWLRSGLHCGLDRGLESMRQQISSGWLEVDSKFG